LGLWLKAGLGFRLGLGLVRVWVGVRSPRVRVRVNVRVKFSTCIYCSQIPAGTGISTSVNQGPYPRPVAVLVCKSDVPGHL